MICGDGNDPRLPFRLARATLSDAWRNRGVSVKALSFAMIGVVNTLVDVRLDPEDPFRWGIVPG